MATIKDANIGGGIVRRGYRNGTKYVTPGTALSREDVLNIPRSSRSALIEQGRIEVYPPAPAGVPAPGERFVVRSPVFGSKTFDVIEGVKIASGISKEEAEVIAAVNQPAAPATPAPEEPPKTN